MYESLEKVTTELPRDPRLRSLASVMAAREQSVTSLLGTKFFRTVEVASVLGVHPATVLKWVKLGLVQAVRTGHAGRWRISEQELIRLQKGGVQS